MCGSSPSTSTEKTTTVNTTTETNIRDIGLTGASAVDMAAVLESGVIQSAQINSKVLETLIQETGEGWNRLIGGAGDLVQTAGAVASNVISEGQASRAGAENVGQKILDAAGEVVNPSTDFAKMVPWLSVGAVAMIFLLKGK